MNDSIKRPIDHGERPLPLAWGVARAHGATADCHWIAQQGGDGVTVWFFHPDGRRNGSKTADHGGDALGMAKQLVDAFSAPP